MARPTTRWTKAQISKEKAAIKAHLDGIQRVSGSTSRLEAILDGLKDLEDDHTAQGQLRRFVFVVSALFHHERFGGLTLPQVRKLSDVGEAILQTQGVHPGASPLAFLYGELHFALSQVYRKAGDHWMSAWEQSLSHQLSPREPVGGEAFQALAIGMQSLRLGHAHVALRSIERAESLQLPETLKARARVERIRATRLGGDPQSAMLMARETLATRLGTEAERQEIAWEAHCASVQASGDVGVLMGIIRRGRSHYHGAYALEATLWARCTESKEWLDRVPTMKALSRNPRLKVAAGLFQKCAAVVEECYRYDVPFDVRLHRLGTLLPRIHRLVTVDKELLVWAAMARWLARSRTFDMAVMALCEYRALSLRLSLGANPDVLGLLGDILTRPWFLERQAPARPPAALAA